MMEVVLFALVLSGFAVAFLFFFDTAAVGQGDVHCVCGQSIVRDPVFVDGKDAVELKLFLTRNCSRCMARNVERPSTDATRSERSLCRAG